MPNRLKASKSPYLLQHANNPVDWYPWGSEALDRALAEDKPILVSIGYSACHWCHVMERESFENHDIATLMNDSFICIKVDREERPDVDQVYMDSIHALGQHGGWPLNVFLTPDQRPFFGGTYFSPPAWSQVLINISKAFVSNRDRIESTAQALKDHLSKPQFEMGHLPMATPLPEFMEKTYQALANTFDHQFGGFDRAPKFVMPSVWRFIIAYYQHSKNKTALEHLALTLNKIASGGIHDIVNGGFARYSVDDRWFAPHFEKMLYDNAQLLALYAEAFALTGFEFYEWICDSLTNWVLNDMVSPEGGFYSALDADSEGVEGFFYTWTYKEIETIVGTDAEKFCEFFSATKSGNWEHGRNILYRHDIQEIWSRNQQVPDELWINIALEKLHYIAESRIRPALDDKIILAWNAQMVMGLITAYRYTTHEKYLTYATKTIQFLEAHLISGNRLQRIWKETTSDTEGFLDDYAFTIAMYIEFYQITFNEEYLTKALSLTNRVVAEFHDPEDGFFYYTAASGEKLFTRRKELTDNVIPGSNSVMAGNLIRLGYLFDRNDLAEKGSNMIQNLRPLIEREPGFSSQWALEAFALYAGFREIVIVGPETDEFRKALQKLVLPATLYSGGPDTGLLPTRHGKNSLNGKTTIYICQDRTCLEPVTEIDAAVTMLNDPESFPN